MDNKYIKRNSIQKTAINEKLYDITSELLKSNPEGVFAISKKFKEKSNGSLGEEIVNFPIIMSSIPIKDLVMPSCFKIVKHSYISTWCDNEPLAKIEHKNIIFEDGDIKGNPVKDLYMKIK